MSPENIYHKSVMVNEVLEYLDPQPNKIYVDATFGGGGHTKAILDFQKKCKVIGLDWDKNALELNGEALKEEYPDRLELIWGNFGHLTPLLKKNKIKKVNGILADFGTSQFQIHKEAGFSFLVDTPLDMRMSSGHYKNTAYDIVNKASEQELATIFWEFGGESYGRKIARAIVLSRKKKKLKTTKDLANLVESVIPAYSRKVHPATKVFQALRIVVNDELNNIRSLLKQSLDLLEENGRIVCISFHSLEDVIVKQFFKSNTDKLEILTKKVVKPTDLEVAENASSRSAKLRAARFITKN